MNNKHIKKNGNSIEKNITIVVLICISVFIVMPLLLLDNYETLSVVNNEEKEGVLKEKNNEESGLENESIDIPLCVEDIWECNEWGTCFSNGTQKRICTKTFDCPLAETPSPNINKSCEYNLDSLDPLKMYLEILKKVKSAPNSIMTSSYDSGTANITFIWEWVASENLFVLEVKTNTYLDVSGKYISNEVVDIFQFRDHDLDGRPDDYWCDSWGYDLRFKKLDKSVQEFENLNLIWAMGIDYFLENILMK